MPAGSKSLAKFRDEHAGEFATTANDGSYDELDADYQINSGDDNIKMEMMGNMMMSLIRVMMGNLMMSLMAVLKSNTFKFD
jgi:hypothetical protein